MKCFASSLLILPLGLALGASYDDVISCESFPDVVNYTDSQLQQEASRRGNCIPYTSGTLSSSERRNPCDRFYTPNVDYIYLPFGRSLNRLSFLNSFAEDANLVINILSPECRDPAARAICYYYYPPCGNLTHFEPPNALCQDVCDYLTIDLCKEEWMLALTHLSGIRDFIERLQIPFVNCSQPGAPLGSLLHCCSDSGIEIIPVLSINLTITPSKPLSVLLGDYISLNCSPIVPTSEELSYTWTHLLNTSTVLEEDTNILTFSRISMEELGTYRCSVTPNTGEAQVTITSARALIEPGGYPARVSPSTCLSPQSRDDILVDVLQLLSERVGLHPLGLTMAYSAESCDQVAKANPNSPSGMYWIYNEQGDPVQVPCQF